MEYNNYKFDDLQKNIIITGGSRTSRSELLWMIATKLRDKYNKMIICDHVLVSRRHLSDPLVCVIMTVNHIHKTQKRLGLTNGNIPYSLYTFVESKEHSKANHSLPCDVYNLTSIL
jgi:hypothetical protein